MMRNKATVVLLASVYHLVVIECSTPGILATIYGENCTEEGEEIEQSFTIYQCRKNRYYPIACRQNDTLIDKGHIQTTENFLYECSEWTPGRLRLEIVACRLANLSKAIYPGEKVNISSEVTATCAKIPPVTRNGTEQLKLKIAGCIDAFGVYVADGAFFTNSKSVNTTCDVKGDGVTMESLSYYAL